MTKNAVATTKESAVPAFLPRRATSIGNVDQSDLILPRVKLLQAISPEVETFEAAKAGNFWHSIAEESLGTSVKIIPIVVRKSYVLWAPRGDQRGILARADDGINWDIQDDFKVKPKGSPKEVIWSTKAGTVAASRLDQFGTSIPDDSRSVPAATLQYNILAYAPDYPDVSPFLVLNARSAIKPAKKLISKLELGQVDHFARVFELGRVQEQSADGPFWNYSYIAAGYVDEDTFKITSALYERYKDLAVRANDTSDDAPFEGGSSTGSGTVGGKGDKF